MCWLRCFCSDQLLQEGRVEDGKEGALADVTTDGLVGAVTYWEIKRKTQQNSEKKKKESELRPQSLVPADWRSYLFPDKNTWAGTCKCKINLCGNCC